MWGIYLAITLVILLPTSAGAQHPLVLERLKEWNAAAPPPATAVLISEVMKSALVTQKSKGGCIPTSAIVETVVPATAVPFVFNAIMSGQTKNAWTVVVRHPNCDADVVRYTVVRQSDDALYGFRTNRGRSNANETLIGDTFPLAILGAKDAMRRAKISCRGTDAALGVTRIAEEEADLAPEIFGNRYKGSWREIWPVTTCGRTAEVEVRFTADGDGGTFTNLASTKVKLLPEVR